MNVNVILSPDDFAEDLEHLGRANGNVYHRQEGVPGLHDGQYMVRLKKKRFVILDYSIVPTDADFQAAAVSPHIHIPDGAGKQQCSSPECAKVGVPVCLYDSVPDDTLPLYLRSGMCFTCQRYLNEKRRTVRKRKSDGAPTGAGRVSSSGKKKSKADETIVISGPIDGAKPHGPDYGYSEIGEDLARTMQEVADNTNRLLNASGQTSTSISFNASAGAAEAPADETPQDIASLYEEAFMSMSKGLYMMSQWKASWDAAVAAAVAQETADESGLAEAVASAAAVAAATDSQDQNSANMVSLLLAAEKKGKGGKAKGASKEVVGV